VRHVVRAVLDPSLVLLELGEQHEQLTLSRCDLAVEGPDPFDQGSGVVRRRSHEASVPGEDRGWTEPNRIEHMFGCQASDPETPVRATRVVPRASHEL
jgi:hypothetical protein